MGFIFIILAVFSSPPSAQAMEAGCGAFAAISQSGGDLSVVVETYDKLFLQELANHPQGKEILDAMIKNKDPFKIPTLYTMESETLDNILKELQRVIGESRLNRPNIKSLLLQKSSEHNSGVAQVERKIVAVADSPQSQIASWGMGDVFSFRDLDWLFAIKRMEPGKKKTVIRFRSFSGKLKAPPDRKVEFPESIQKAVYDPNTRDLYCLGWEKLFVTPAFTQSGVPSKDKPREINFILPASHNSKDRPTDISISPNGKQILMQFGPNLLYVAPLNGNKPIALQKLSELSSGSFRPIGWMNENLVYGIEYQKKVHVLNVTNPAKNLSMDSLPLGIDLKQLSVGLDQGSLFFVFYNANSRPNAIRYFFNAKKGSFDFVKVHELDTTFLGHDEVDRIPHDSLFLLPNEELLNVHFPFDGKKAPELRFINAITEVIRLSVPVPELRQLVRESSHRSVNGDERVRLSSDGKSLLYDIKNTKGEIESRAWNLEDFMR